MTGMERLERVEKELLKIKRINKWLIICVSLGFCVIALFKLFEPQVKKEIKANKFIVYDVMGTKRAELGIIYRKISGKPSSSYEWLYGVNEAPELRFYDKEGGLSSAAVFANTKQGPELVLLRNDHMITISISDSSRGMKLMKNGKHEMIFGSTTIAGPNIFLCDTIGQIFWRAPLLNKVDYINANLK